MGNRLLCLIVAWAGATLAQGVGTPPSSSQQVRSIGVITELRPGSFTLHADVGPDAVVLLPDGVSVLRVPPGAKDLNLASKITASEISVGDRVLVRGRMSEDQKSVVATSVIVMTKTDLATAREAERLEWQRRAIGGPVSAVNSEAKEVTISVPTTPPTPKNPSHPVTIALDAKAVLLRYAPDSVKFGDAKPSTFEQIKIGDQVRALGTKSEDGSRFTAEKLVSGTFRNLGVTVISVDEQNGAVKATDLASGEPVLVRTNGDSELHRLPPALAQMVAAFNSGGTAGGTTSGRPPGAGDGSENGPVDFQQMLGRAPRLALGELKPGERLIVVSTEGAKSSEVTAIVVLAGVEPILATQPKGSSRVVLGPWNMGMREGEGTP
jgi:hypothetical protein